jgi:hypothetical protein
LRAHTTNKKADAFSPLGAGNLLSIVIVMRHTHLLVRTGLRPLSLARPVPRGIDF